MRSTSTLVAVLLIATNAHADQFRFTGNTTAGNTLISDALRQVIAIGEAKFNCPTADKAEAEVLPESYKPPGGPHAEGKASTVYERWRVTFCGSKRAFLIAFWPAADGGMMFRVEYPFPGEGDGS
jgi:hypothetical protein